MKVVIHTLGCKVNAYEADCIAYELEKRGVEVSTSLSPADIYILVSCAVTNEGERKSRQCLAKFRTLNPNAKIIVCGCASAANKDKFIGQPNVKVVLGTSGKQWIPDLLDSEGDYVVEPPMDFEEMPEPRPSRTRAYLKVQDGCNNFCSYCLIPYIRGRSRSRSLENILVEAFRLAKTANEIVLTGINLSDYGNGLEGDLTLTDLVSSLSTINARLRLSSMEVNVITKEFLAVASNSSNFCPHFHLSLQSGSDGVLKRMNRKYTGAEYLEKVRLIRQIFPDAGLTTDIIVGFPDESDEEFNETLRLVCEAKFHDMHIFPYSIRGGTVAAKIKQVDGNVVKDRVRQLESLRASLRAEFLRGQAGKTAEVLTETFSEGYWVGHTPNFLKVYFKPNTRALTENIIAKVVVKEPFKDGVLAELA